MPKKPGLDPRTLVLGVAIGVLEISIVALWLVDDATISAWLGL
jgi:hypothetical protein